MIERIRNKPKIGIIVLTVFHFFGAVGLLTEHREWFVSLTWLNLSVSFFVLLFFERNDRAKLVPFMLLCYLISYTAEFVGVNYGLIFGDYEYGKVLGPQLGGVPLLIGVNWFMVVYCCAHLAERLNPKWYLTIVSGAIFTVLLDFLIEPVAIELSYWRWGTDEIPLSNYIGWLVVSLVILIFFRLMKIKTNNPVAVWLLFVQALFFTLVNWVIL